MARQLHRALETFGVLVIDILESIANAITVSQRVGERDRVKGPTSEAPRFEDENPALSESAPEEEEIHDQASEGEESENLVEADDMDADENEKSANNS